MERFQANKRFYEELVTGFSSSDEFDAKKRVQVTNELPPESMFDMAHSLIKNDLWKWFFGWSSVLEDVPYSESTDGVETADAYGNISTMSIAKYVNGVRAKDYGPLPKKVWNPDYKKDFKEYSDYVGNEQVENPLTEDDFKYKIEYPKARRIEISGTLLPEVDLMLHEAYRYLSVLYPDHPDFSKLLTYNEFEDEINHAAALIDYVPDHEYFNWFTNIVLPYPNQEQINEAKIKETSMMKIRNLTNHAMRRKFFGSKTGYKMFGSDVFQHVAVYPAAQVIPFKEMENEFENQEHTDFSWLRAFERQPDTFKDSEVDKSHVLYKKRVRLLDWTNDTYRFPERWTPPAKVYGTAWPTPYSQFILYEYPLQKVIDDKDYEELKDGLSTTRTIKTDFRPGQRIQVGGQDCEWSEYSEGHVAAIREESTYKVEVTTASKSTTVHINPSTLTVVDIDFPVQPVYTEFTVWPSSKELIDTVAKYESLIYWCSKNDGRPNEFSKRVRSSIFYEKPDLFNDYIKCDNLLEASDELHSVFYDKSLTDKLDKAKVAWRKPMVGKFTPDPHQDGCLYMCPEHQMTLFEDELNIKLLTDGWDSYKKYYDKKGQAIEWPKSEIEYGATSMSDEGIVRKGDLLEYNGNGKRFETQVLGISNAWIQFKFSKGNVFLNELEEALLRAKDASTARYGLVMKLSDNNPEGGGKKVVFYGSPIFGEPELSDAFKRLYMASSVFFNIKAIPRVKSHAACRAIYGKEFADACKAKYEALEALIGVGDGKTRFSLIKKDLDSFNTAWKDFEVATKELQDAAVSKNLLFRDSHWKKLNKTAEKWISLFKEERPILWKQLDFTYTDWHKVNDVSFEKLPPAEVIAEKVGWLHGFFKGYYEEYSTWQIEEAAIDPETQFYQRVYTQDYGGALNLKNAVLRLKKADDAIMGSMLPNRAFLITPLPDDLLMREWPSKPSSYTLLTGQDEFDSIIEFRINKYDDQIEQYATSCYALPGGGLLNNVMSYSYDAWNFGALNTATVVETHWNPETREYDVVDVEDNPSKVDFIDDYYHSSEPWIKRYRTTLPDVIAFELEERPQDVANLDEHAKEHLYTAEGEEEPRYFEKLFERQLPYWCINEEVQEIYDSDDSAHKFAYGDPNMMEMFLESD